MMHSFLNSLFAQTVIAYLLIFAVPMVLPVVFLKVVGLSGLRTLVTYEARDTPLHKLDPRLKVLYPVGMGILSILFTWKFMLIVFGLTILPWFWLKPSRAMWRAPHPAGARAPRWPARPRRAGRPSRPARAPPTGAGPAAAPAPPSG